MLSILVHYSVCTCYPSLCMIPFAHVIHIHRCSFHAFPRFHPFTSLHLFTSCFLFPFVLHI
ncbi:hypothetical protein BC829DRAFT_403471 [Chytridium lagenaria]|nr:hypothetical protein BC829DRAFT_403471 [Chytridium lagenaria]